MKDAPHSFAEFQQESNSENLPFNSIPERRNGAGEITSFLHLNCRYTTPKEAQRTSLSVALEINFQSVLEKHINAGGWETCLQPGRTSWDELNLLRTHAGAPEKSQAGIRLLCEYLVQLKSMEAKFQDLDCEFTWFESQSFAKSSSNCIQFEKANVLFNIAAVLSQLGAQERSWTQDGRKRACDYFQVISL